MKSNCAKAQAEGCLSLIAFYYLLRVGEYTKPKTVRCNGVLTRATRTQSFTINNIGFFKKGKTVSRRSPLKLLLTCDAATLKLDNQKNGRMGGTIHQEAINKACCPVKALAYRVNHILTHGGKDDSLLCTYYVTRKKKSSCKHITSTDIIKTVRTATKVLKLAKHAIDPDLVGAHSLRAGGAMALKLHGYDDTTIMKVGR